MPAGYFTGLYDKRNKPILNGDILFNGSYKMRVEWGLDNGEADIHQIPAFILRYLSDENLILSPVMPETTLMTKAEISQMEIMESYE